MNNSSLEHEIIEQKKSNPINQDNLSINLIEIVNTLNKQLASQEKLINRMDITDKDVRGLMKHLTEANETMNEKLAANNAALEKNLTELNLQIHILNKIPQKTEDKIANIAPVIGEELVKKHSEYLSVLKNKIDNCNATVDAVRHNFESFEQWRIKRVLWNIGGAAIIATIAAISATCFVLHKNPPKKETTIFKANNVTADGQVHILDMSGKFCDKARMVNGKT